MYSKTSLFGRGGAKTLRLHQCDKFVISKYWYFIAGSIVHTVGDLVF